MHSWTLAQELLLENARSRFRWQLGNKEKTQAMGAVSGAGTKLLGSGGMKRRQIVIQQDNQGGGVSYREGGAHHSVADRDGVSLAAYIHALYGLVRQSGARQILMIGCGGGTLATMLKRAGVAITLVDNDPLSFEIARTYFHLPETATCELGDGAAFLRRTKERYDAIVLDAYGGGRVPRHLVTASFFGLVRARLTRGGIFAMNVIVRDDDDRAADRIGYRLKKSSARSGCWTRKANWTAMPSCWRARCGACGRRA